MCDPCELDSFKKQAHRELFSGARPKISNVNAVGPIALRTCGMTIPNLAAKSIGESQDPNYSPLDRTARDAGHCIHRLQ
jgi:hypothetical protein